MKKEFETRKLYFGFPVFFLGYKDQEHGYNISTSSSAYSLGSMMVVAMRTKGNAVTQIKKYGGFSVNIPLENLITEVELAGFNSRKDKFAITGLTYDIGEEVDAPLVNECPVSIECEVVELVECGALTNIVARVKRRVVEDSLLNDDNSFKSQSFSPIGYIGDGNERQYRFYNSESVKMGSIIKKIQKE